MIDVLWYFTDLPYLDKDLAFNNRLWDSDDLRTLAPGEVFPISKKFHKPITFGGLNGLHQCGEPGDFENGQPWPYTGPPIGYDPDGIPTCCDRRWGWGPDVGPAPGANVAVIGNVVGGPTVGAAPGGDVSAELVEVGGPTVGAAPGGIVSAELVEAGGPTVGAAPGGDVVLNCPSYSFVCVSTTVTLNVVTLDTYWSGTDQFGNVWELYNHRYTSPPIAGAWVLRPLTAPAGRGYGGPTWNGRGTRTFTKIGLWTSPCTGNPPTVVVTASC